VPLSSDCAPGSTRALLMMRPAVCKSRALGSSAGADRERRRSSALVCSAGRTVSGLARRRSRPPWR
jgi:hypothetical protein